MSITVMRSASSLRNLSGTCRQWVMKGLSNWPFSLKSFSCPTLTYAGNMTSPDVRFAESFINCHVQHQRHLSTSPTEQSESGAQPHDVIDFAEQAIHSLSKSNIISVERSVGNFCDAYVQLAEGYPTENKQDVERCLTFLAHQSVNRDTVKVVASEYIAAASRNESEHDEASEMFKSKLEDRLRTSLTPPYIKLFQKIGQLPGGVKFLVDLRSHLITATKTSNSSSLKAMNIQLKQLLSLWFSVGFLNLEQVTWDSSCSMLQKISEYEAVHPVRSWTDLKARVGNYRRCFVYTHRSMPSEPIVVLHVALMEEIPSKISNVVRNHRLVKRFSIDQSQHKDSGVTKEGEHLDKCKAAIFYSITSTQTGLQGIELGTYLIKQAVQRLKEDVPSLEHFSTLSPIPGFKNWLITTLQSIVRDDSDTNTDRLFTQNHLTSLGTFLGCEPKVKQVSEFLLKLFKSSHWAQDDRAISVLEDPLLKLCANYLYVQKRRGLALDPVMNFHIRNGAILWRINWRGDFSARGLDNSFGIMVNYKYCLDQLEENSQIYQEKQVVMASQDIKHLAEM